MADAKPLDAALDALFVEPVEGFIAKRDALAKQLKAEGEKDASAVVKGQHKPTQAAHALNRLVRAHPREIDVFLEASRALAAGKDFKAALEKQRAAQHELAAKAAALIRSERLLADAQALVAVVLGAAVDPALAQLLRAGRFSKLPDAPVGFFGVAPPAAPLAAPPQVSVPSHSAHPQPKRDDTELREAEAEARVAAKEATALAAAAEMAGRKASEAEHAAKEASAKAAAAAQYAVEALRHVRDATEKADEAAQRARALADAAEQLRHR